MTDLYNMREPHGSDVEHVWHVGPRKPLGFVNYNDIEKAGFTPPFLKMQLEERGVKVVEMSNSPSYHSVMGDGDEPIPLTERVRLQGVNGPLFYAYDEKALTTMLNAPEARKILDAEKWPHTPEAFLRRLHEEQARPKTALFDLISDTFGSKRHPGRLDVKAKEGSFYAKLEGKAPIPLSKVTPRALQPSYAPEVFREVLENAALSEGSQRHFIAQAEIQRGVEIRDWRDELQAKRAADKNSDPAKRS